MLIPNHPRCVFPYKFKYVPSGPAAGQKRPLLFTEIRRKESKHGFLRVEPMEEFVLDKEEYHRLFMREDGAAYSHEFIFPIGPVEAPKEAPKEAQPPKEEEQPAKKGK